MIQTVFVTGATGVMGSETLRLLAAEPDKFKVRVLARPGRKNEKKLAPYIKKGVAVTYGDLLNYEDVVRAMGNPDIVLHIGGMVSPHADHFPAKTLRVNIRAAENIVKAVKALPDPDAVRVVYIGSVAQISSRHEPLHWGRSGDPLIASVYDYYGVSKILAERVFAESGLKRWVSLRQSGILHPGLLMKGSDVITFHVPLRGVLEWATLEDSGRLMRGICNPDIPDTFWRNFYNIGSGEHYRLSNYRFEQLLLKAVGCPRPEKVFDPEWFATRNFHGCWYTDSDRLNEIIPFRANIPAEEYFDSMAAKLPWYFHLAPIAPPFAIKAAMKMIAMTPKTGTLSWSRRGDNPNRLRAFFGSDEARAAIPGWKEADLSEPSFTPTLISHGYDETKPLESLTIADLKGVAKFRGGKLIAPDAADSDTIDPDVPMEWECAFGHRFALRPRSVLLGGHWCPECIPANPFFPIGEEGGEGPRLSAWRYDEEAKKNPFLAQVWQIAHSPEESEPYISEI